ncbi:uncharacterized protein PV09_04450 [Verruconis gallopava]|uniref:Protein kinase domain-containing protein n=1 Tax=Verruconis gallopava TaxID=253628 RepID=A0A0D1YVI5_9PEZI|nr:uncharacterized protein PV09_04450 [Verruconis gallopava]KIW04717.1 hypothetical protein PV09_04450 [Verruconis gallopava]
MESYGHGHLPRGRGRYAPRHYSDSKAARLTDFSNVPEREADPELVALHSEFKIQRERLAAWGREWGDDRVATGEAELDDTFERAELKDAVQDVLENVKNVLDESERISHGTPLTPKGGEKKGPFWGLGLSDQKWTHADRSRYEQLADELKTSIDLLYDISKTRREIKENSYPGFAGKSKSDSSLPPPVSKGFFSTSSYSTSEETLVNTTRSSTQRTAASLELPSRLDPSVLDIPAEEPPPYDSAGATPITRMIGHYRLPAPPSQLAGDEPASVLIPVLIEYAPFDASYRTTGVPVPTNRLDTLMSFYARCGSMPDYSQFATLSCLGYFEDPKQARFGLVYELPKKALDLEKLNGATIDSRPVSLHKVLQQASKSLNTNRQLPPGPPLEDRFRLAFNLMQAFAKLHMEEKILHKDVNSSNIIFFLKPTSPDSKGHEYDLRSPYVSSFDLFSEFSIEEPPTAPGRNLYRHPHDPKIFNQKCEFCDKLTCTCARYRFDIYGLGLVLLEIGLWGPLSDIFKQKYSLDDFRKRLETIWVRKLASRCGSIYQSVVKECLQQASQNVSDEQMRANYTRWLKKLRRCCLLDEDEEVTSALTPTRVSSISGAPQSVSPESTIVASEASNNPFLNLRAAPTTSFFSNPFARFTSKKTPLPFSIKEEYDSNPFNKTDDLSTTVSREFDSTQFGSELELTSTTSTTARYSAAAKTIQKAWRSHRTRRAFQDYKKKIVIIQKAWRRRQSLRNSLSQATQRSDNDEIRIESELVADYTHFEIKHHEPTPKPKLRLHNVKLTTEALDYWHDVMLPKLERICERCLRDSPETVSIDLVGVGETALSAKPTIFITCSSTSRVRCAINRKFHYDHNQFDLRVRRGRVRRSKVSQPKKRAPPHRSMMNSNYPPSDNKPLNPFHQERPLCGASIGAYVGNKHLPPVSYGGVVRVDGEPYGMTVHHLLDSPSDEDDSEFDEQEAYSSAERSSARRSDGYDALLAGMAGHPTLQSVPTDSMFPLEISDDDEPLSSEDEADQAPELSDEEYFSSDFESEPESIETEEIRHTMGDLTGVHPGQGTDILVTQPALDDVDDDFFPNEEDRDDDHLDSHKLGFVHASSGIRRWNRKGSDGRSIVHEIDWALLKLDEARLQPYNLVQGGRRHLRNPRQHDLRSTQLLAKLIEPVCRGPCFSQSDDEFPVKVAGTEELGNLRVHCFGRTSGLQGGVIGPAMSSVRIYRRRSFSRSWHVIGNFGVGGDSGAWVIDNDQGRVCGHVLAWCERNAIAYICPMEVILEDIKRTLGAKRICLPGGEDEVEESTRNRPRGASRSQAAVEDRRAQNVELPDIARLDFGDRQRLGLGGATAEDIMRRSAASAALKGLTSESRINGASKGPRMEYHGVMSVS